MATLVECNDCGALLNNTTSFCTREGCSGKVRQWGTRHPNRPDDPKPYVDVCTHKFPQTEVQVVTCDPHTVTVCTQCGQGVVYA